MKRDEKTGGDPAPLDEETADHLLDFLDSDDAAPDPPQVERDLRRRGIDMDRLFRNVMADVEQQEARRELERARRTRPSVIRTLHGVISDTARGVGARVEELRERATELLSGPQQAAFFRDLEQVDSEEDLRSLLDDIACLDALQDGEQDVPASDEPGEGRTRRG
jgi:hypothetical protein